MTGISQCVQDRWSDFWRMIGRWEGDCMVGTCIEEPIQLRPIRRRSTIVMATAKNHHSYGFDAAERLRRDALL